MTNIIKKIKKGFTLLEMLIVVAIISIIVAISIPVFQSELEKARNATDVYNAKVISHTVIVYLETNPEAFEEFLSTYGENPNGYRPYVLVTNELIAVSSDPTGIILTALDEAGLLGEEIRQERYNGIQCKTKDLWKSYTVGFTVIDGELVIGYCGLSNAIMNTKRWTTWSNDDTTTFKNMCLTSQ